MTFKVLSNAACRVSLRGPETELDGGGWGWGVKHTQPNLARLAPSTSLARDKAAAASCLVFSSKLPTMYGAHNSAVDEPTDEFFRWAGWSIL